MTPSLSIKNILGGFSSFIAAISYIIYIRDIFVGNTRPHAFSWLIWGTLTGIAFVAQISDDAGAGAWVTGLTTFFCGLIAVLAFFYGEKNITRSDWITFIMAILTIPIWYMTQTPLYSVIIICMINALAYYPTIRKTWVNPYSEHLIVPSITTIKFFLACWALDDINFITATYPIVVMILNTLFIVMAHIRRHQLSTA